MKVMKCCPEPQVNNAVLRGDSGWVPDERVQSFAAWRVNTGESASAVQQGRGWEGEGQCEVGHKSTRERMEPEV